jgi:predicted amidohydrolase YtcJ
VKDGRIVEVGGTDEILWLREDEYEVIDLDGRTVIPASWIPTTTSPSARWRCSGPIAARPTAARAAGLASDRGALVSGKRADFLVLFANPLECPPGAIKDLQVLQMWVEGNRILVRP